MEPREREDFQYHIWYAGVEGPNRRRKRCVERAVGPENRQNREPQVHRRRKDGPKNHGKEDKVMDVGQPKEDACKEEADRKMEKGRQRIDNPGNVTLVNAVEE